MRRLVSRVSVLWALIALGCSTSTTPDSMGALPADIAADISPTDTAESPADATGDTAADAAADAAADTAGESLPEDVSGEISGPMEPDPCTPPETGSPVCTAAATLGLDTPEHVTVVADGSGGALVAWSVGPELKAGFIQADGSLGPVHSQTVEAVITGLTAAPSDDMLMVFYSTGQIGEDPAEEVLLRFRAVTQDGGFSNATELAENFQLRGDGIPTDVGPRVQGITRQVSGQTTYDLIALTLLNHDGSVRTTHTVRVADAFSYYRIHASGARANYPYVDAENGSVSYYEQSVYLLACGLPLLPAMLVKPDAKMLTTGFWNGMAVWVVRNPEACDGGGGTRITFHQTGPRTSVHRDLGLSLSDRTALAVSADNGHSVLVDDVAGRVTLVPLEVDSGVLGMPRHFDIGAAHGEARSVHPILVEGELLLVRLGTLVDGSTELSTWRGCAAH